MNTRRFNHRLWRRIISVAVAAAALSSCVFATAVSAEEVASGGVALYVSPDGDDSAAGTVSAPLKTLEGARDAVRELRKNGDPEGGITVYIREGVYEQSESLVFSEQDSATETCPITYTAYNGEDVVITGGYTLDPTKYTVPSDAIKARLQSSDAKAKVVAYDLAAAGVDYSDITQTRAGRTRIDSRLYYDGIRGWTGRYPNDDRTQYAYVSFESLSGKSFVDSSGRIKNWAQSSIEEARLYGMFEIDWSESNGIVTGYDAATGRVTIESDTGMNNSGRYFYYNVLEEVDSVGEYYIDDETGMLYFYAPDNYRDIPVRFALCRDGVICADVDYYTFNGLTVECGVDDLIVINGDGNTVSNCTVRDCSDDGIKFCGSGTTVYNNELSYIGGGGINGEMPNTVEMKHSDTVIDNNLIHDYAELHRVYNAGVGVGGVSLGHDGGYGVTVSHNEIYNGPHLAISYLCRDAVFEYNYIHDVCYEAGDAGAVYDGTWLANGMVFRHNVIKDIVNKFNIYMTPLGYYCDDSGGGKTVYSNIFINTDGAAIATSGQDNDIHDNILIDASSGKGGIDCIYADSRSYYKFPGNAVSGWTTSAVFGVSQLSGLWSWMMHPGFNPAYGTEQWAYRYPWTMLLKTTNVYDVKDRFVSYAYGDSKVRQNVLYPATSSIYTTAEAKRLIEFRDNLMIDTMDVFGFADAAGGDYNVSDDAAVYRLLPGFKPCDFAQVGRRAD